MANGAKTKLTKDETDKILLEAASGQGPPAGQIDGFLSTATEKGRLAGLT
jgi:hypothetical protein